MNSKITKATFSLAQLRPQLYTRLQRIEIFCDSCKALREAHESGLGIQDALSIVRETQPLCDYYCRPYTYNIPILQVLSDLLPKELSLPLSEVKDIPDICRFLEQIQELFTAKHQLISTTIKQLRYPFILLLTSIILLTIFWTLLFPMLLSLFDSLNTPLPFILKVIGLLQETLSKLHSSFFLFIGILILALSVIVYRYFITWMYSQKAADILEMIQLFQAQAYSLKDSLELLSQTPLGKNKKYRSLVNACENTASFSKAFNSLYSPPILIQRQLCHHEALANLSSQLKSISASYQALNLKKQQQLLSLLSPLCFIFISILITGIAYLSYIPLISSIKSL